MSTASFYETGMEILMENMSGFDEPVMETEAEDIEPILDPIPPAEYPQDLTDEEIQTRITEIGTEIESLPAPVKFNGYAFSWREDRFWQEEPRLKILQTKQSRWDFTLYLSPDGNILDYSFYSTSGKNNEDAEKSAEYLKTCAKLLSEDFRGKIIADYREKFLTLEVLTEQMKKLQTEQWEREKRRNEERQEREELEIRERRQKFETEGQVWYNYQSGASRRYVVKKATEKFIMFNIRHFSEQENAWVIGMGGDTCRYAKHLLGFNPGRGVSTAIRPVGTDDITGQKQEVPETLDY